MPTFKNTSSEVFQDGDLILRPDESIATDEPFRIEQFRGQYAWQFSETKSDDAPTEAEAKDEGPSKGVRELRTGGHVQVDDEGAQAEKVGKK